MSPSPESYNPRRFRSTVPYYARYRLAYPDSLIAQIVEAVGLRPGDPVMDLGCGPGLLAVPFARIGMRVVAVDPEPDMLEAARAAASDAGVELDLRQGSSFALPDDIGPFKLVTMGRSFHWMDRKPTLEVLGRCVTPDGALAFVDDNYPNTAENAWRRSVTELANKYGRLQSPNQAEREAVDYRSTESLLLDSAFSRIELRGVYAKRTLSADDVIGLTRSLSTTSPERLGDKQPAFEAELRSMLAAFAPDGMLTELAEITAQIARRP